MWIIISIILAVIAIVTLLINIQKNNKIDSLEYEVAYLLDIIFNDHGDVVLRQRDNELTDKEVREIKDAWDKFIK